jgi:hypothetical protein
MISLSCRHLGLNSSLHSKHIVKGLFKSKLLFNGLFDESTVSLFPSDFKTVPSFKLTLTFSDLHLGQMKDFSINYLEAL